MKLGDRYAIHTLPMGRICDALESTGAIALPILRDEWRERLLAEARLYRYRAARKKVGRDSAEVQQRMDVEPNLRTNSLFHELTADFQAIFDRSLDQAPVRLPERSPGQPAHQAPLSASRFAEDVDFNDLMLQRYTVGDIGITPHRDRTDYRSIVVLFVLCGRGRFCVAPQRTEQGAIEIPNGPGDMVLMRAPGFLDGNGNDMSRPYHFVHNITETRYIFGLRDDLTKRRASVT